MSEIEPFPEGYTLRAATAEDAPAIADLVNEVCVAEIGVPWITVEQIRDILTSPGRDPALADALLLDRDGSVAGYLQFEKAAQPLQIDMLAFVPPHLWGRGLSAWILRLGEERSRARAALEPAGGSVPLRVACFTGNEPARRLFAALGYAYVRTFWMMRIELEAPPPAPRIPDGIAIRTFERGRDEVRTHAALSEAFADHWGSYSQSFDEWLHHDIQGDGADFDPSLWFLAVDGEEVVGAAICQASTPRAEGTAQVGDLAVRRPWRRRGIALALLHTAFSEIHRRGIPRVELGVDSESPTGATRLYERAGMHPALGWEFWETQLERSRGPAHQAELARLPVGEEILFPERLLGRAGAVRVDDPNAEAP
jgi:mycothiol synthase